MGNGDVRCVDVDVDADTDTLFSSPRLSWKMQEERGVSTQERDETWNLWSIFLR